MFDSQASYPNVGGIKKEPGLLEPRLSKNSRYFFFLAAFFLAAGFFAAFFFAAIAITSLLIDGAPGSSTFVKAISGALHDERQSSTEPRRVTNRLGNYERRSCYFFFLAAFFLAAGFLAAFFFAIILYLLRLVIRTRVSMDWRAGFPRVTSWTISSALPPMQPNGFRRAASSMRSPRRWRSCEMVRLLASGPSPLWWQPRAASPYKLC